ncbi:MAG: hypothetical protein MUC31_04545 [Bacteroidales bacterium]|jgi:hypothetical protein|nr:hypothetical protein [Bacteroidales bacterium]
MKRLSVIKTGTAILFLGLLFFFPSAGNAQQTIDIQVSPNVLNIQNNGQVVTVHTDIAYSLVDAETVSMNGVDIYSWKADLQGNFVAKFQMSEVKALVDAGVIIVGEYNELVLTGSKTDGTTFTGSDMVLVINVIPKKK